MPSEYFQDFIHGSGIDKSLHKWQQSEQELEHVIEVFSKPGDTILDIFMGSCTTGVVCMQKKRKFIGYEVSEESFQISEIRLKNVQSEAEPQKLKTKNHKNVTIKLYQGDCRTIIPQHHLLNEDNNNGF